MNKYENMISRVMNECWRYNRHCIRELLDARNRYREAIQGFSIGGKSYKLLGEESCRLFKEEYFELMKDNARMIRDLIRHIRDVDEMRIDWVAGKWSATMEGAEE